VKNLLIIYNIIFLLVGNVIFSNIHYFHNHNHNHGHNHSHDHDEHYHKEDTVADNECLECDIFEVNSGFVFNNEKIKFTNNNYSQYIIPIIYILELDIEQYFNSRAPPVS
tara:strand:- start:188 stop:517 length:330 start_codon:yes stop_codon:yes gene_type:complete